MGGFANYGHDGATLTFFSSMVLVPELRMGVFVATNTEGGAALPGALPRRIVEQFCAAREDEGARTAGGHAEALRRYEGVYLPTRRPYHALEGSAFRMMQMTASVAPDGYLSLAAAGQPQRFLPGDRPGELRAVDDGLIRGVFAREDAGRLVRLETMAWALEPVRLLCQVRTLALVACAGLVAMAGTFIGVRLRLRRRSDATPAQRVAGALQLGSALAWLVAVVALGVTAATGADQAAFVFDWPHPAVIVFSSAALVAALLAWTGVLLLPAVWRPRRGMPAWTTWRTLRFTLAIVAFAALGTLLAFWGALQPWNP